MLVAYPSVGKVRKRRNEEGGGIQREKEINICPRDALYDTFQPRQIVLIHLEEEGRSRARTCDVVTPYRSLSVDFTLAPIFPVVSGI